MSTNIEAIGLGAMNLDLFYSVEQVVTDGETAVKAIATSPGGSAANTIYALAKLGVSAGYIGAVGNDNNGRLLIESLQSIGVDTSRIRIKAEAPTGTVLAITDTSGHRALYVLPGANNLLNTTDVDLAYLNQASIVHLSPFVSEQQFELQKDLTRQLASRVMLSFAPGALYAARGLAALQPILSRTHALFANRKEIETLTGQDFQRGANMCLEQGCREVVVTFGKGKKLAGVRGVPTAYVRDRSGEYFIVPKKHNEQGGRLASNPACHSERSEESGDPSLPLRVTNKHHQRIVDTTGAGDAFAAGFLYGLLKNRDLHECGLLGDLVARFSLTCLGARDGLPSLALLSQAYLDAYHRNPVTPYSHEAI